MQQMNTAPPDLLTPPEVIHMLRMEDRGVRDPRESLRHLRRTRQIGYTTIGRRIFFPLSAVLDYIDRQTVHPIT
jgi:hypothetical protein